MSGAWSNCCCGCFDDGQVVYASRKFYGYRGVGWKPSDLPQFFDRVYRKVTITHTKSLYYPNGSGGWIYWKDFWIKLEIEYNDDATAIVLQRITGSTNGLIHEVTVCPSSSFTKAYADWIFETDPTGATGYDEMPPWPGFYPSGGSDTQEFLSVSEGSVSFKYTAADGGGTFFVIKTDVVMEEPLDTTSIRELIADMMIEVPLTKSKYTMTGDVRDVNGDPESGTFGFPTKGADFNHMTLIWDITDPCEPLVVKVPHLTTMSDVNCRCSVTHMGVAYSIRVYPDRKQTYLAAAFDYTIPGGGTGDGSLYATGTTLDFIYGFATRWLFPGGTPTFDWQKDPDVLTWYEVSGWAKKSCFARTDPDDWTVLISYDEDGDATETCMAEDPVTKCYRFYYPADSDSAVDSSDSKVFSFGGEGKIYREIPELTAEMEEDCVPPPVGEAECPVGGDGESDEITDNPCIP